MPILLALLLAAAPDCHTSTDAGTVINCGGAKVLVSIAPGAPREALPRMVEGMTRLYTAVEKHGSEVQLGKLRVPAIDLTLFAAATGKKPVGSARVTAVPEREGLSRVLVCVTEPPTPIEHCQPGFEAGLKVANPTPPEARLPEGSGPWSGVPLTVPAGCQLSEPGAMQCKSGSLMWGDRPPDGPLNSQKVLAELAFRQLPRGATMTERSCRIGGKASSCSVLRGTARGAPFTILIGVGDRQGRWTSFQCIVAGELRDTVPVPCDQLVSLEVSKSE